MDLDSTNVKQQPFLFKEKAPGHPKERVRLRRYYMLGELLPSAK